MPSGYWHHVEYLEGSFGIAIRSLSPKSAKRFRGLYNVSVLTQLDEVMRFFLQDRWHKIKTTTANKRATKALEKELKSKV